MRRGSSLASLAIVVWFLPACTDLAPIAAGVCGNGVVEGREDCDSHSASCGQPNTVPACRFVCTGAADCPHGWHCGGDGICRQPTGTFRAGEPRPSSGQLSIQLGDFDADGHADLLSSSLSGFINVDYHGASGFEDSAGFLSLPLPPAVGQLTSDSADDVIHFGGASVGVERGQSDRSLAPTVYASIPIPQVDVRFWMQDAHEPDPKKNQDVVYFGADEILEITGNTLYNAVGFQAVMSGLPLSGGDLAPADVPHGNLDERVASPCEEFVLMKSGDTRAYVFTPCKLVFGWNDDPNALPPVNLPAGATIGNGGLLARVNADAHLDLIIGGPNQNPISEAPPIVDLYVAFGVGDGTFHSDPNALPAAMGDNQAVLLRPKVAGLPLAAGDFNADGRDDLVFTTHLGYSRDCGVSPAPACFDYGPHGLGWLTHAIAADFNANGLLDVIATVKDNRVVEFMNGTGTAVFNTASLPTNGVGKALRLGDFDGDLVLDAALIEGDVIQSSSGTTEDDSLTIAFGKVQGPPDAPVSMGQVGPVEQIQSGQLFEQGIDYVTDIAVLTADATGAHAVALFTGSTNRELESPFRLTSSPGGGFDLAVRAVAGRFDATPPVDLAALGFDQSDPKVSPFPPRLWLLPVTGEASMSTTDIKATNLGDADIDACTANFVAMDLDGDGIDEVVAFGRPKDLTKDGGRIGIARVKDGAFVLDSLITVDDLRLSNYLWQRVGCRSVAFGGAPNVYIGDAGDIGSVQVADLDGDGTKDVLALAVNTFVVTREKAPQSKLVAFMGGAFDPAHRVDLTLDSDALILGMAALNADSDPAPEIVVVTDKGVLLTQPNLATGKLSDARPIIQYPNSESGNLIYPNSNAVVSVAVGDLDADGLDDFVVGREKRSEIYYAVPVRP